MSDNGHLPFHFGVVPEFLKDRKRYPDFNRTTEVVYAAAWKLASHTKAKPKYRLCWKSLDEIAKEAQCTRECVRKHIRLMRKRRVVFRKKANRYDWAIGFPHDPVAFDERFKEVGEDAAIKELDIATNNEPLKSEGYRRTPLVSVREASDRPEGYTHTPLGTSDGHPRTPVKSEGYTGTPKSLSDTEREKSNTKNTGERPSNCPDCLNLLKYYNEMTNRRCRPIDGLLSEMHQRHQEYSVRDCARVIQYKFLEWYDDPKSRNWVNLETLFRPTKFDKYLNEIPAPRLIDYTDPDVKRLVEIGVIPKEEKASA